MWRAAREGTNSIAISTRLNPNITVRSERKKKRRKLTRITRRRKGEGKI